MTQRQRENAAKYLYDLSKIVFATAVIGKAVAGNDINVLTLALGASMAYLLFWWAHLLDGRKYDAD